MKIEAVERKIRGASERRPRSRRALALAGAAVVAIGLSACGKADMRETSGTYAGENGAAAPYLNVGKLVYQVQISRSLNPWEAEDAAFLVGLPSDGKELKQGEAWLGIFMQVYNETKSPQQAASEVTVSDAENRVYYPMEPKSSNLFAYRPGMVPAKGMIPAPDTAASYNSTGGALLVYKIKLESLEARPLTIHIVNPEDPAEKASAELDV